MKFRFLSKVFKQRTTNIPPAFAYRFFHFYDAVNYLEDLKAHSEWRTPCTTFADVAVAIFQHQGGAEKMIAIGARLGEINIISEHRLNDATREAIDLLRPIGCLVTYNPA